MDNSNNIEMMERLLAALANDRDVDLAQLEHGDVRITAKNNIRLFNNVKVDLAYFKDCLHLMDIIVDQPVRGEGWGSKALQRVLTIADELGVRIELYSHSHDRSPLKGYDLSNWYERHGFEHTPRGHVRAPQTR
ncbi:MULTISPECIES: GNAT family N-acetyltransferase [Halomonas]|uniref:GNAT family N-acetyltransferase n=1 Tax=Halomonas TaxID=2745 RepID=UPI003CF2FFB8